MPFTAKERQLLTRAFQNAWKALLQNQRITVQNIERAPTMLMEAIVEAAHAGERDEIRIFTAAAIARMTLYELEAREAGTRQDKFH